MLFRSAEQLLIRVLKRAKELTKKGVKLPASKPLQYFLNEEIILNNFNTESLETFSKLDDYDIVSAMKAWQYHEDFILKNLCDMIINRDLLKVKIKKKPIEASVLIQHKEELITKYSISKAEADYFVFTGEISNQAYTRKKQGITILHKNGKTEDVVKASDQLNLKALAKPVTKYYICYPKS